MKYEIENKDETGVLKFKDDTRLIVQHLRSDKYYGENNGEPAKNSASLYADSQNDNIKKYCYCRIIEPAVSAWVFSRKDEDGFLDVGCRNICHSAMASEPTFRQAVLKTLKK